MSSVHYLSNGLKLIWQPGIRTFVFIPLFINLSLLSIATVYAFNSLSSWYQSLQTSDNGFIQWIVANLDWLLWPLLVISVLVVVFFLFAFLANWIAAPFNGLLSEAVERHLAGESYQQQNFSYREFFKEIPRLFAREWRKFIYYFPRALACLLLFITPLAVIAPILWFLFNAWMAAIQYLDYPMDNHKVPFNQMLLIIKEKRSIPLGFGCLVMLLTIIPGVNLLLMPVAVAGATNLWFDLYRQPMNVGSSA